jgi:hypothetical protein
MPPSEMSEAGSVCDEIGRISARRMYKPSGREFIADNNRLGTAIAEQYLM